MKVLKANWPAPPQIHAFSTTRQGGFSSGEYASLNLGLHVQDNPQDVLHNRKALTQAQGIPQPILWLNQCHTSRVLKNADSAIEADGSYVNKPGMACVVLTADCLPLLLTTRKGDQAAALHCGWRGLERGIIKEGVKSFTGPRSEILAWLGPAIGPKSYEVGIEIYQDFCMKSKEFQRAFRQKGDKYLMNLYEIARIQLKDLGVTYIYGGEFCTFSQEDLFFSYRRDRDCGRIGTFIWIDKSQTNKND